MQRCKPHRVQPVGSVERVHRHRTGPQIGRNSISGPGFNNLDFRVSRNFPIHDKMYFQVVGEAFNAINHTIITSVNSTYSTYVAPSNTSTATTAQINCYNAVQANPA